MKLLIDVGGSTIRVARLTGKTVHSVRSFPRPEAGLTRNDFYRIVRSTFDDLTEIALLGLASILR